MPRFAKRSTFAATLAATVVAASVAGAGVDVTVSFNPFAAMFAPDYGYPYGMYMNLYASGFVNDMSPDNFIELISPQDVNGNSRFGANSHPNFNSGSGSILETTIAILVDDLNDPAPWTLRITDGTTHVTSTYTLHVFSQGIEDHFLRPISISIAPGDHIPAHPTVTWTQPGTAISDAQYLDAYASFYGGDTNNYYGAPGVSPEDTQWTPDDTLANDAHYTFNITMNNASCPQDLVEADEPVLVSGPDVMDTFTTNVVASSFAQSDNLVVGPTCGTSDYDGDGDSGTDSDIEAFFACLAGSCCATCYSGGSDFNADGDYGTDADIESFFRVLGGSPC